MGSDKRHDQDQGPATPRVNHARAKSNRTRRVGSELMYMDRERLWAAVDALPRPGPPSRSKRVPSTTTLHEFAHAPVRAKTEACAKTANQGGDPLPSLPLDGSATGIANEARTHELSESLRTTRRIQSETGQRPEQPSRPTTPGPAAAAWLAQQPTLVRPLAGTFGLPDASPTAPKAASQKHGAHSSQPPWLVRLLVAFSSACASVGAMTCVQDLNAAPAHATTPLPVPPARPASDQTPQPKQPAATHKGSDNAGKPAPPAMSTPGGAAQQKPTPKRKPRQSAAPRSALNALASGRYDEALKRYQRLHATYPDEPAYSEAVRILRGKLGKPEAPER